MDALDSSTDREPDGGVNGLYDELESVLAQVPPERRSALWEFLEMNELVADLQQAIKSSGLTHYAIGKSAGVATAIIDRFVSDKRDIRLETAGKIAAALGYRLQRSELVESTNATSTAKAKKSTSRKK